MIKMRGKNDFCDRFDFFKWSAPIYENPKEAVLAFEKLNLRGKVLQSVSAIGFAEDICKTSNRLQYGRLLQAGMDLEKIYRCGYEHMDKILLPCEAELSEPFQLVFTDGTTLEILPMERGAVRFAVNSIPAGLTTGVNRSNLDAQALFGKELVGKEFEEMTMDIHKDSTTYLSAYIAQKYEPREEIRTKYHYRLEFSEGMNLHITAESYNNGYRIKLRSFNREIEIPYARVTDAKIETDQIVITPGHASGGSMWITPVCSIEREDGDCPEKRYANWAISMDDDICYEFLGKLLYRYFDRSQQKREEYDDQGFDWYGSNRYTYETIQKMLADIKMISGLLEQDFDAPELEEIKANYHAYTFGARDLDEPLTDEQKTEWIKNHKHIAIDFYERFVERMETIMRESKGCDTIVFSGP